MKRRISGLLLLSALLGCATSPGDVLFSRGQYASAADAYEADLKNRPGDAELLKKQAKARDLAIEELAARLREVRGTGDLSLQREYAADLLSRYRAWGAPASARALVEEQAALLRADLERQVQQAMKTGAPLRAWGLLANGKNDDLVWPAAARGPIEREVVAAGRARCERARARAAALGPYAHLVTHRYCAPFGFDSPKPGPAPATFGRLNVESRVDGLGGLIRPVIDQLENAFRRSVWFDERSAATLKLVLVGHVDEIRMHSHTIIVAGRPQGIQTYSFHRWPKEQGRGDGTHAAFSAYLEARIDEPFEARMRSAPVPNPRTVDRMMYGARKALDGALMLDGEVLRLEVERTLEHKWRDSFCRPGERDPELAARCVLGNPWAEKQPGVAVIFGDPPGAFADALFVETIID